MRYVTYWWIFFWVQIVSLAVASYLGILNIVWRSDVSKISFAIIVVHVLATCWIGYITRKKALGVAITNEHTGWFLSEAVMMMGMIGTIIGFIYTLITTLGVGSVDPSMLRQIVSDLAKGIGTAGWTTLFGMVASLCLKLQMNNVESI